MGRKCKHRVYLAFHKDYTGKLNVVSYCIKCGKILDDNIKINDIDFVLPNSVEYKATFIKEKDT